MSASGGARPKIDPELVGFGTVVKRCREAAGLKQGQLADLVNVARSYISHVECGRTKCRRDFAERVDNVLDAGGEIVQGWDDLLEQIKQVRYPTHFVAFPKAEASADQLRVYEHYLVYGLFQTQAYARVLLVNEDAVATRMKRQALLSRTPRPMISVVMEESVLHREVGSKEVMREQLEHLIELSLREGIFLQIARTRYYRGVRASFTIATQGDRSEIAYIVKATGGETTRDPSELAKISEVMHTLNAQSLNTEDSRALIRKVIEERWT
ncbi:helix-turn-helix domain-containing protein [Actinomadura latina]|uniref:Helix-turn-helix domain-containing protein n=1 Tax=Actinomadura latina TaxID=163603 RepID=A0A846YY77_9ACTN|nr:helix-turn-helix transcriptional regulator [Actinomadura latina]NKZ03544.1 helix-turn-helix domain-containing protein [Actinomadura latina]